MRRRRDVALVGGAFALCPLVAALAPTDPAGPVARGHALLVFERRLGLGFEPALVGWASSHALLLTVATLFYTWVHLPATVGALVWARLEHPRAFPRVRDAFLATQALVVLGYLLAPTAPPRLLDGARPHGWPYHLQSPYAAMPSGHVAFSLIAAATVAGLARPLAVRLAALAYPPLVLAVVVLTGNHLWIDAVGGTLAAAAGTALAVIPRTLRAQFAIRRAQSPRSSRDRVGHPSSPTRRTPERAAP
jgi:hypothetical protein